MVDNLKETDVTARVVELLDALCNLIVMSISIV